MGSPSLAQFGRDWLDLVALGIGGWLNLVALVAIGRSGDLPCAIWLSTHDLGKKPSDLARPSRLNQAPTGSIWLPGAPCWLDLVALVAPGRAGLLALAALVVTGRSGWLDLIALVAPGRCGWINLAALIGPGRPDRLDLVANESPNA